MPTYNERTTIARVLVAVSEALPGVEKDVIVVDDGSRDGTREWLKENIPEPTASFHQARIGCDGNLQLSAQPATAQSVAATTIRVVYHDRNQGKGAALRTAIRAARGTVVVIQDADLEYDPADWAVMYPLIAERKIADVVYGSRFYGRPHRSLYFYHYIGNRVISLLFNALYNQTLTDSETCYKMFSRAVKDDLHLTCNDFGCEVQVSAQIALARRWRIYEVGISYFGRTYSEGKKIDWRDGVRALWYLAFFRIFPKGLG
jgi:glycosyltransferase involved in cell wall biosynthesis